MIEISITAPDFTLPQDGGDDVTLSALQGSAVVLFFYPRDDTPGCTKESIRFSESLREFADAGAQVFGISKDSLTKHGKFTTKHSLTVPLLSDEHGSVCENYGVWKEKNMYGKTYMGIERTTVLIGADGKIAQIWAKVKVPGHVEDVLGGRGIPVSDTMIPLAEMAVNVLKYADGRGKAKLSRSCAAQWQAARAEGEIPEIGRAEPPIKPGRPDKPELLNPRDVPHRKPGTVDGRIALIHAVAHIELNAIDLHWDIIARFSDVEMPIGFYDDWVKCADEESKHFNLMADCLEELGSFYGALPAHAGMWQAAQDTATDFMGRLAVVPMVLEARGLDVTPKMIYLFKQAKQKNAVAALETIYAEEVAHVAYGSKWFHFLCGRNNLDPKPVFHNLVTKYFHSTLKPPFNEEKRAEAGIPPDFYWPLAAST